MLVELAVRNLGVIAEARIPIGEGLVALTGETGAGKTMITEALELLSGGKADAARVRSGADEAVVEALLLLDGEEIVVRRVIPATGRSRAYINGELSTAPNMAAVMSSLVEIHGQHGQQALLSARHQRRSLDQFAGIDTQPLRAAKDLVTELSDRLERLTGDGPSLAREAEFLRYQIDEIERIAPEADEEERLQEEEELLSGAVEHRDAATLAAANLADDGAAVDRLAKSANALMGREPFRLLSERLAAVAAELDDCVSELRSLADSIEPNDERLAQVRSRRHALVQLRRKYGEHLSEVLAYLATSRIRLEELSSVDETAAATRSELEIAMITLNAEAQRVGDERRAAAPLLGAAVQSHLAALALPDAQVAVAVSDGALLGAGEQVEFMLAANPGVPLAGLAKVASGGELSRVMLALRLVLSGGPSTMIFDEVDAGIGGTAAVAVGEALAGLAVNQQVVVVTHLAQVAAHADHQLKVSKATDGTTTSTTVTALVGNDRVVELSRMLSGTPESATAQEHASELLLASQSKVR